MSTDQQHSGFLPLYLAHLHDLRAYVGSVLRDWALADDVVQEVSVVLWERFSEYDPAYSFGAWARGIARNKMLKEFERSRRRLPLLSPEAIASIDLAFSERDEAEPGREREALRHCLGRLGERPRRLLAQYYGNDLSLADLAAAEAGTVEGMKKALWRLRSELHRCITSRLAGT